MTGLRDILPLPSSGETGNARNRTGRRVVAGHHFHRIQSSDPGPLPVAVMVAAELVRFAPSLETLAKWEG